MAGSVACCIYIYMNRIGPSIHSGANFHYDSRISHFNFSINCAKFRFSSAWKYEIAMSIITFIATSTSVQLEFRSRYHWWRKKNETLFLKICLLHCSKLCLLCLLFLAVERPRFTSYERSIELLNGSIVTHITTHATDAMYLCVGKRAN